MPVYDFRIKSKSGPVRSMDGASKNEMIVHITHELEYVDFNQIDISVTKKRGKPSAWLQILW